MVGGELKSVLVLDAIELGTGQARPDGKATGPGQPQGRFLAQPSSVTASHLGTVARKRSVSSCVERSDMAEDRELWFQFDDAEIMIDRGRANYRMSGNFAIMKELAGILIENGVAAHAYVDSPTSGSGGSFYAVLTVAIGSGGAVTALAISLQKFITRHASKKVTFSSRADGTFEKIELTGYSIEEVEQALKSMKRFQSISRADEVATDARDNTSSPDGD